MHLFLKMDAKEIQKHQSLKDNNGKSPRLDTIHYWIKRIKETGDVKTLPKSGRPKLLDSKQELELIDLVKKHPKKRYNKIRSLYLSKKQILLKRRTLNDYCLRNKISKIIERFFNTHLFLSFFSLFLILLLLEVYKAKKKAVS